MAATHEVFNAGSPVPDFNALTSDPLLYEAVRKGVDETRLAELEELGGLAGGAQAQDTARLANAYPPVLRSHDRYGNRIDEVEFHPAWHELMSVAVRYGLQAAPWAEATRPHARGTHLARAAGFFVWGQVEQGHCCPISMSYSVLPALRQAPEVAARYEPGLVRREYDFGLREPTAKTGLLAGMAMTEKQGGSDVRANTTRAVPDADGSWRLTGHKWFCSAPMSDLFLMLAQTPDGLGCFAVPRTLPDGSRNAIAIQRLKDKLGNKSNASSEIELDRTRGWLVGDPGRGVRTIIDMVTMTRLDCVIGSASLQRAALVQALHHVHTRSAFGHPLADQPLMQEVLADLALEVAAATALVVRLAEAVDGGETAFVRLAVAASKFWVCKRAAVTVAETLECLGGAGYVEESPLPRYLRESPLNSIWEGSGNVIALDVVRALHADPAAGQALLDEVETARGADVRLDAAIAEVRRMVQQLTGTRSTPADPELTARSARTIAAAIARTLQAALLVSRGPAVVADAFLSTRFDDVSRSVFGSGRPLGGSVARGVVAAVRTSE